MACFAPMPMLQSGVLKMVRISSTSFLILSAKITLKETSRERACITLSGISFISLLDPTMIGISALQEHGEKIARFVSIGKSSLTREKIGIQSLSLYFQDQETSITLSAMIEAKRRRASRFGIFPIIILKSTS